MKVMTLEAAKQELHQAKEYYDLQRPGLGTELVEAFEEATGRIVVFPKRGPNRGKSAVLHLRTLLVWCHLRCAR